MNPGFPQEDNYPVVHVSWHDAVAFCHWLTDRENQRYRLPTEAEWEMACRAGTTTDWSFGNKGETSIARYGNIADAETRAVYKRFDGAVFASDGYAYTSPVGSLRPNPWGFYDMHGNVFEWCHDYYDAVYYHYSAASDPSGGKSGSHRVQRGGGFFSQAADSRSAYRESGPPDQVQNSLGFRVLRKLP